MRELVRGHIARSIAAKEALIATQLDEIVKAGSIASECFRSGGKLLSCGNGGSAGDAQHIATEFLIRYKAENIRPSLPAISLAADSSAITACGNDFGFDSLFSRQVEGLGRPGDCLLAITTSGNSRNVLEAVKEAKKKGMKVIFLSGRTGGKIFAEHAGLLDAAVLVPADETSRIQECHIMVGQIICAVVEKELYGME